MYRPEGLGFEVEMPGKPKIEIEKGERDDIIVRSGRRRRSMSTEPRSVPTSRSSGNNSRCERRYLGQQLFARGLEGRITREVAFTMNGFEGREFAIDGPALNAIVRLVLVKNRGSHCPRSAIGPSTATSSLRRFLDSLKLVP